MTLNPTLIINPETGKPKFEFAAGTLCLDFCNTTNLGRPLPNERLKLFSDLVLWGHLAGVIDNGISDSLYAWGNTHPDEAEQIVIRARRLRQVLHRIYVDIYQKREPISEDLGALNASLGDALQHQRLQPAGEGYALGWDATSLHPERVLWPVIKAAGDLLASDESNRVRQCGGEGCSWLFLDLTRNHSRRWCSMEHCGNRMRVRRHYRRSRE